MKYLKGKKEERKKREGKSKARKISEQLLRKAGRGIREKESKQTGDKKPMLSKISSWSPSQGYKGGFFSCNSL